MYMYIDKTRKQLKQTFNKYIFQTKTAGGCKKGAAKQSILTGKNKD